MEYLEVEEIFGVKGLSFSNSFRSFIESFPKNEKLTVLDLGCGYGQKSLFLASGGWAVTALDIDTQKLDILKTRAEQYDLGIDVVEGDMKALPLQDNLFDIVICLSTIHHQKLIDIENTLSEIFRILKPGGQVFFDILSINDPSCEIGEEIEPGTRVGGREGEEDVPHHYSTKKELKEILTNYSKIDISENSFAYKYNHKEYICVLLAVIAVK